MTCERKIVYVPIYLAPEGIPVDPTGDHEIHEHDFVQDDNNVH